jgi:hypothetical protein
MIELSVKKVTIRFEGAEYQMRHPSVKELREYQKQQGDDIDKTIVLLDKCGLPKAVSEQLDFSSLEKIFEELTPKKKA